MYSEYYSDGTVTLTNGSAVVSGSGTAWSFFGVANGELFVPGYPSIPIASVQSDGAITLAWAWPHDTVSDGAYTIGLVTADQVTGLQTNWLYSQVLSRDVGFAFDADAEGDLAGRDAYDGEGAGFRYGIFTDPDDPVFYRKVSAAAGNWAGPFKWRGPEGEGGATGQGDRYAIIVDDPGKPGTGEVLHVHAFADVVSFATDMGGSQVVVGANPTASAQYSLTKNGTEFATLTIATDGTPTFAGETAFGSGDVLRVIAPNPRDDTLSGVSMTLAGNRA